MNTPDNLEERFRQLEREVNAAQGSEPSMKRAEPEKTHDIPGIDLDAAKSSFSGLISWINGLTGPTKIAAIAVVGIIAFTILNFLFKLIAAVISLGIMALIVYVLYKLFFEPQSPNAK